MAKKIKDCIITFKCRRELQFKVERVADAMNITVSELMRDITTRAIAGYQGRLASDKTINEINNGRKLKGL
jgi:antitoxin component of RelBE/YafQ-DinJ toxin-antitoxin module